MRPEEFTRQLDELQNFIGHGIAYFSAWHSLTPKDKTSSDALNRYNSFFSTAHNALLWAALMQLAKTFDPDRRTISLRSLLTAAKNDRKNLTPHSTEEDLLDIERRIDDNEKLLGKLKRLRDQRLAHYDSTISEVSLNYREVKKLVKEIETLYNRLRSGHDGQHTAFRLLAREVKWHTSKVVGIMRKEKARASRRVKRAENTAVRKDTGS